MAFFSSFNKNQIKFFVLFFFFFFFFVVVAAPNLILQQQFGGGAVDAAKALPSPSSQLSPLQPAPPKDRTPEEEEARAETIVEGMSPEGKKAMSILGFYTLFVALNGSDSSTGVTPAMEQGMLRVVEQFPADDLARFGELMCVREKEKPRDCEALLKPVNEKDKKSLGERQALVAREIMDLLKQKVAVAKSQGTWPPSKPHHIRNNFDLGSLLSSSSTTTTESPRMAP